MSKEQISNFVWEILTQFFAKANIFFIAVGGSFIVLVNAYHIKKQTFWDSVFEMVTSFVLGYMIGWITFKFTNNQSIILSSALISCLASKSIIGYVILNTPIFLDKLAKAVLSMFIKKIKD